MWECVYCLKRWPKEGPAAVEKCGGCGAQRGVLGRQANNTRELARLDSRVKQKKGRALNAASGRAVELVPSAAGLGLFDDAERRLAVLRETAALLATLGAP